MNKLLTQSKDMSREYCCSIVKLGEVMPVEGSDFLGKTIVDGFQIVVRKDMVHEGDIMFYASNETELNEKFLSINNQFEDYEKNANYSEVSKLLKRKKEYLNAENEDNSNDTDAVINIDEKLKTMRGFFNKYGRVKMITLRKCPSLGYLFSIDAMANYCPKIKSIDFEKLLSDENADLDFDTVDGELFVKAYVPRTSHKEPSHGGRENKRNKKLNKIDRLVENQFVFHYDTQQLNKNIYRFNPDDEVYISVKMHGCVERNTVVDTLEYGEKIIGDIVDNKLECHIKAFDVEEDSAVYVPIDNFYFMPNDGEWYEIELEDGKKITITGNNPVWLPLEETYRRVEDLSAGDTLLVD